jgi:hypothetical protein
MGEFNRIRKETHCPFAKKAKVWAAPPWDQELTLEENVFEGIGSIQRFIRAAPFEKLDGFVFALPADFGKDLRALQATTAWLLHQLCRHLNPSDYNLLDQQFDSDG